MGIQNQKGDLLTDWFLETTLGGVADAGAAELPPAEVHASRIASLGYRYYFTSVMVRCISDTIGDRDWLTEPRRRPGSEPPDDLENHEKDP
jgi:hypothetical protein